MSLKDDILFLIFPFLFSYLKLKYIEKYSFVNTVENVR